MHKYALFLSVKPKYVKKIISGGKSVDLRRNRPTITAGKKVIIYSTSPEMAILAISTIDQIITTDLISLWNSVSEIAGVSKYEFDSYFKGANTGSAIHLKDIHILVKPICLKDLREMWPHFNPPQSFKYCSNNELNAIIELANK